MIILKRTISCAMVTKDTFVKNKKLKFDQIQKRLLFLLKSN